MDGEKEKKEGTMLEHVCSDVLSSNSAGDVRAIADRPAGR
jgi:hypothetical protein